MFSLVSLRSRRVLPMFAAACLTAVGLTGLPPAEAAGTYEVATVDVGGNPSGVGVDPSTHIAYVTNVSDHSVSVIDGTTNTVTATVPVGNSPYGVGVDPSTHTVYVTSTADSSVSVIDGTTNTVTATVPVGGSPYGVGVDPSTHTVYVANIYDSSVSVIDGTTNTVTATVDVGGNPYGVGVDPSTHTVYVTNIYDNSVSVIDGTTNTVTATVPVGNSPNGVGVDASTHNAYVTNFYDNSVSVIDGTTNTVTATVPVGSNPFGVGVDPSTHNAYVTNFNSNSVSVIDGTTNTVTATVPVGNSPYGVGVDASTHTAYVTNHYDSSVSVIAVPEALDAPAISGIAPSTGSVAGGTEVVITGSGFTDATAVRFGLGLPATSFTVNSDTQITAVSPAATKGTRNIRVRTAVGVSPAVAAGEFTYTVAAPAITGIARSSGPMEGGTVVVITGTDLTDATSVRFGIGLPATSFTVNSDTQITAVSPASSVPTRRDIRVTTAGGVSPAVAADRFTWLAPVPVITGVDPSSGPLVGGTVVVITGTDFRWATRVRFGNAGAATTFTIDSPTQITATSPASATTTSRHVRVTTSGGESAAVAADLFTWQ